MRYKLIILVITMASLFAACKKEPTVEPKKQPVLGEFNRELIIGKWEAVRVAIYQLRDTVEISRTVWAKDSGMIGPKNTILNYWSSDKVSMITFSANNTFYHKDPSGNPGSYMLDGIFPSEGNWNLAKDTFTISTEYNSGTVEVPWGSAYTLDNDGRYIVGLTKVVPDTSLGYNDLYQYVVVLKKQ